MSIYLGQLTELNYAHIAFALVFSEIIDLSWLIIYTDVEKILELNNKNYFRDIGMALVIFLLIYLQQNLLIVL